MEGHLIGKPIGTLSMVEKEDVAAKTLNTGGANKMARVRNFIAYTWSTEEVANSPVVNVLVCRWHLHVFLFLVRLPWFAEHAQ